MNTKTEQQKIDIASQISKIIYDSNFATIIFKGVKDIRIVSATLAEIGVTEVVRSHTLVSATKIFKHEFVLNYKNQAQKTVIDEIARTYNAYQKRQVQHS